MADQQHTEQTPPTRTVANAMQGLPMAALKEQALFDAGIKMKRLGEIMSALNLIDPELILRNTQRDMAINAKMTTIVLL